MGTPSSPRPDSTRAGDPTVIPGAPSGIRRRPRRPWWKGPLLGLITTVGFACVAEWGARAWLGRPADAPLFEPTEFEDGQPSGWTRSAIHYAHPQFVWANIPNLEVEHQGVLVKTNAFGLRGPAITRQKPPGVFRILSLGESSSFGWGIAQNRTYAAVLERVLNTGTSDRRVEVLNAGTVGWSMAQSIVYLEQEGLLFEPDAVLLYHGFNDFLDSSYLARRTGKTTGAEGDHDRGDLALLRGSTQNSQRLAQALRRHSVLFHCLQLAWRGPVEAPSGSPSEEHESRPKAIRVPDADRRLLLERFRDLAGERDFEPILLIPAYRSFSAHRELLVEFAQEGSVQSIDLEDAIPPFDRERNTLFLDPCHPRQELHRAIANLIAEHFQ